MYVNIVSNLLIINIFLTFKETVFSFLPILFELESKLSVVSLKFLPFIQCFVNKNV